MKTAGAGMIVLLLAVPLAAAAAKASPGKIETVLLPSPGSPLVAVRIAFRTGSADDPAGKEGLAALAAGTMAEGATRKRSYADLLDALYPLAASVRVQVDKEMTVFSGTVHRDNLAKFAALLEEQLLEPAFAPDDFARNRQSQIDEISKTLRGNDDEELGKEALNLLLFGGTSYGHPVAGTVAGLTALTREDVVSFYHTHFTRDRLIVGLAGGYPEAFVPTFVSAFDRLPAAGAPVLPPPNVAPLSSTKVLIVKKHARANAVSIGAPVAATRSDAGFYPLYVANSYLGEHRTFNGVLMNELRGARGLNYGDYSYAEGFVQEGWSTFPEPNLARRRQAFSIWIRPVAPVNTLFSIRAALYYLHRLEREGIPEQDFAQTKKFLSTYEKLWTQNASRRLGYAIDARLYGRDLQKELAARLPGLTREQAGEAARKYLPGEHFAIAIVADDADEIRAGLLSDAPTPIRYDTEGTPAGVLAVDREIEKYPLPVRAEDVRIVPAGEMFEK